MNLTHRFSVPATLDEAWAAFGRLDRIAPCFPGATVTSEHDGAYHGFVKIKFGPVPLVYAGTAHYTEINREARRMVVEAHASDRRGSSNAAATVTATFTETGKITDIQVLTDLAITGRPAQFGKGVVSDVSDKLLDLFLNCASERFTSGAFAPAGPATTDDHGQRDPAGSGPDAEPGDDQPEGSAARTSAPAYIYSPPNDSAQSDLHVFTTIVPVLLKRYWPVIAVGSVVALVAVRVLGRSRRR